MVSEKKRASTKAWRERNKEHVKAYAKKYQEESGSISDVTVEGLFRNNTGDKKMRIKYWIIKMLVGKKSVMCNCYVDFNKGQVVFGEKSIIINNMFEGKKE